MCRFKINYHKIVTILSSKHDLFEFLNILDRYDRLSLPSFFIRVKRGRPSDVFVDSVFINIFALQTCIQ